MCYGSTERQSVLHALDADPDVISAEAIATAQNRLFDAVRDHSALSFLCTLARAYAQSRLMTCHHGLMLCRLCRRHRSTFGHHGHSSRRKPAAVLGLGEAHDDECACFGYLVQIGE
jgi:hypothetical protein